MSKSEKVTIASAVMVFACFCWTLLATENGDRIESSARRSYVFATFLKSDDIRLQIMGDTEVVLTGTVSEWSHRAPAEEASGATPRVYFVFSQV